MPPQKDQPKMHPVAEAPPGLETDGKANVIPLDRRTAEDQAKAVGRGLKNPQHEAENPAPMPQGQQGLGGTPRQDDPAGQRK